MEYIGIVENNDYEGEEFGYYFEDTPKVREFLEEIMEKLPEESEFEVILEPIDEETLEILHRYDRNTYMSRVNIYDANEQNWDEILSADFDEEIPFYKGSCFIDRIEIFDEESGSDDPYSEYDDEDGDCGDCDDEDEDLSERDNEF